jgi:hypothetical protein
MTVRTQLIQEIMNKMDKIPEAKLEDILRYIEQIENITDQKETLLSFAGKWDKLGDDFYKDLTINLHENRSIDNRMTK